MGLNSSHRHIGVFGGTFDPIHNGHLSVARFALESDNLDEVLLIPAGKPWLRGAKPVASAQDRLRMTQLAVADEAGLKVSDIDVVREGVTYTVDTLKDLQKHYGQDVQLVLIQGTDSALQMHHWHHAGEIRGLCNILVIGRPGEQWPDDLPKSHPAYGAKYLAGPMVEISATGIRESLRTGLDVSGSVSKPVLDYIDERGLYRD